MYQISALGDTFTFIVFKQNLPAKVVSSLKQKLPHIKETLVFIVNNSRIPRFFTYHDNSVILKKVLDEKKYPEIECILVSLFL